MLIGKKKEQNFCLEIEDRFLIGVYRELTIIAHYACNVPRVLRLFGCRLVARRDSGELEFYYRRFSAVKQLKPLRSRQSKKLSSSVSPGAHPLTKEPEDSGYEIAAHVDNRECQCTSIISYPDPQALWPAVGRQERLWGNYILSP